MRLFLYKWCMERMTIMMFVFQVNRGVNRDGGISKISTWKEHVYKGRAVVGCHWTELLFLFVLAIKYDAKPARWLSARLVILISKKERTWIIRSPSGVNLGKIFIVGFWHANVYDQRAHKSTLNCLNRPHISNASLRWPQLLIPCLPPTGHRL